MCCLRISSFIRSMAPSASVLMASCTWTCNTRWLPPLRSSPSRMLCRRLSIKSAPDLGKPIMPNTHTRIVTTMTTVLPVTFFRMKIFALLVLLYVNVPYCLFLAFAHQVGNRAAGHLELDIIGFHPQHQRI